MAVRNVTVNLSANVAGFTAAMGKASASATAFASTATKGIGGALNTIEANSASITRVGGALTKMGLVGAAGLALVGKAAIDWESAWAGVTKTVDGTTQQMDGLEAGLRGMAKELPATHGEIAAVAEAAGQLGVGVEDVQAFTRVMIDMGESTNLSAEEAATTLARFSNIMGTSTSDVDRLGSVIVGLGNNFATTEAEIAAMGLRIAGAGRQIGLSEADVLGYSAALSSVGVEAEAGGTAISRFMLRTESQVRAGGRELEVLARTAGMTSEEFSRAFEQDAAGAMEMFISGLGRAQESGEDTSAILSQLGVDGIREADALRRLASAGDLLAGALEQGGQEWESNSALAEEAARRYATTESQIKMAWNTIKDAGIDAGGALLPVLADMAQAVGKAADAFGKLPDPVQKAAVATVAVVSAAALLGGGLLKGAVAVAEMRTAFVALRTASPGVATGLGRVAKAAGIAAAAFVGLQAIGHVDRMMNGVIGTTEDFALALIELGEGGETSGKSMDDLFANIESGAADLDTEPIHSMSDALELMYNPNGLQKFNAGFASVVSSITGADSQASRVADTFKELDGQLVNMGGDVAAKSFEQIAEQARSVGAETDDLVTLFPEYADSLRAVATQAGVNNLTNAEMVDWMGGKIPEAVLAAARGNEELQGAVEGTGGAMNDAAIAAEQYTAEMNEMADAALASSNAQIAFEQSVDDAKAAVEENGKTLDVTTQAGRNNRTELNNLISTGRQHIQALKDQGASSDTLTKAQNRVANQIVNTGTKMGMTRTDAVKLAASMNAVPNKVSTNISAPGSKATKKQADEINKAIRNIPPSKRTEVVSAWMSGGYDAAKRSLASLRDKTVTIRTRFVTSGSRPDPSRGGPVASARASGGPIPGWSPHSKADNIPVWATADEYMMQVSSHRKYGTAAMDALNQGRVDPAALSRAVRGYATGGPVAGYATGGPVNYTMSGSSHATQVSATVDASGISTEIRSALQGMRIPVNMGGQTFEGMVDFRIGRTMDRARRSR